MRARKQIEWDIEFKKEDIRNSEVGFSEQERKKLKEELIALEEELKQRGGR